MLTETDNSDYIKIILTTVIINGLLVLQLQLQVNFHK